MRYKFKALIIIEASIQAASNAVAKKYLDSGGGEYSFTAGLSASGESPATHYVANTAMTPEGVSILLGFYQTFFPKFKLWISGPSNGLTNFENKDNIYVGNFDPHTILEEQGLKQINDT